MQPLSPINFHCGQILVVIDHGRYIYAQKLSSCEFKAWKKKKHSGVNEIQTLDLCSNSAVLCQLS